MRYGMLTKQQFLDEVKAKAASQAEIARTLNVSRAAVTGLYNGGRDLSYNEAVKLADAYDVEPNKLTVEKLTPVLRICLRHAPKEWSDHSVERLSQEILYGLELLRFVSPMAPSPDAVEVAARAIAERFQSDSDEA
jgi:transcriptional regulator with XRE-family HTH domain